MYNDLLEDCNEDDYVYVIEGCLNDYISDKPAPDDPCPICGSYDWDICNGYVKDIRQATDLEELYMIQNARLKEEQELQEGTYQMNNIEPGTNRVVVDEELFRQLRDENRKIKLSRKRTRNE